MDKGKCILLVRVSTERQLFDEQENELFKMALEDGYKEEDIIAIAEKESGIKLKEEERKGLNRMKEVISSENVTCVYVWEVSRIGRKKKVTFSIIDFLIERKIQLKIKEPTINLLNPDGTVNDGMETLLTLLSQLAETEMRTKQARWQRTRKANALIGKWNGGTSIKFGYTIDENNFYIIKEEEAKIVRMVYDIYINYDFGQSALRKELKSQGIELSEDRIRRMLSDISYTGETHKAGGWSKENDKWVRVSGYDITYPAIITKETFEKAEQKRLKSNTNCYRGQSFYFGKSLIKCPTCNHSVSPYKNLTRYCCLAYKHDNKDIVKCHDNTTMNIICLDSLLWFNTTNQIFEEAYKDKEKQIEEYRKQQTILQNKIETTKSDLSEISVLLERTDELYLTNPKFTKDRYEKKVNEILNNENTLKQNLQKLENEIEAINNILNKGEEQSKEHINFVLEVTNNVSSIEDFKRMFDLVHQYILSAEWKFELIDDKKWTKIIINQINGETRTFYGYSHGNKYQYKEEREGLNGKVLMDITDKVKIVERNIVRKRRVR